MEWPQNSRMHILAHLLLLTKRRPCRIRIFLKSVAMAHLQSDLRVDPKLKDRLHDSAPRDGRSGGVTSDTPIEAFKADTPLERGFIAESKPVDLFSAATRLAEAQNPPGEGALLTDLDQPDEDLPDERIHLRANKESAREDDIVVREIEKIGGKPGERKEIGGKPITITDSKLVQSEEAMLGHSTGEGSLSARMQSAAAANVKEGVVSADSGVSATKWPVPEKPPKIQERQSRT